MSYYFLLAILALQRLSEVKIGTRNLRIIQNRLIHPLNQLEMRGMILLHGSWFISCLVEFTFMGELVPTPLFALGILALLACQYIRFYTINLLGTSWVHLPIAYKGQKIITNWLYRFIRHPNYLIVILEIALVPLLAKAYYTAIIFSVLNFLFLWNRIKVEEKALEQIDQYKEAFAMKNKLIPFLFSLLIALVANTSLAEEIKIENKTYDEAEKAATYFKFEGHSKKLGIIGSSFDGYAKSFVVSYTKKTASLENTTLVFDVDSLDTDNNSRNEKMKNTCLNMKDYPAITVKLSDSIALDKDSQEINAVMAVRGENVPLKIKLEKKDNLYKGKTEFKLTDAKIPDPSIAIASVKDIFEIEFQVKLP